MALPLALLLAALLALAVAVTSRRVHVDDRDVAWLAGGEGPADAAVADVYRRYLRRHRVHRAVGGWLGLLLAVTYGTLAQGSVSLSVGLGSPLGDVVFCGLAGVVAGALSAEAYRIAAPPGPAVASLDLHPQPRAQRLVLAGRLLLGGALVLTVAQVLGGDGAGSPGAAVAGTVVVGMAEAARRAIADRRRPLLSPSAAQVDARLRAYASTAVARLELAAGALAAGWALNGGTASAQPWLAVVTPVAAVGLLVLALVQLHRARPRPPRAFAVQPTSPSRPPAHAPR